VEDRLQPLIQTIRESAPASVEVVGHTDTRAGTAHNQDLSKRRAARVAALLSGAQVSGVTSRGEGERGARCTEARLPGGGWNEPCLQRDRRVDIVFKTTKG
jgi:OOP family OmpA-OmpF porin